MLGLAPRPSDSAGLGVLESVHLMLCWPSGEKITLRKAGLGMGWLEFKLLPGRQRPSSSGGKFSRQGSIFLPDEFGKSLSGPLEEQEGFGRVGLDERLSYTEGLDSEI